MSPTACQPVRATIRDFLNPGFVERLLNKHPSFPWPHGEGPRHTRIERYWPVEPDCLAVEWSFELGAYGRCALFATPTRPTDEAGPDLFEPRSSAGMLQGIRWNVPSWRLLLHTPDCDPALTQMPACLEPPDCVRDAISTRHEPAAGGTAAPSDVRLLSYRARRRAAFRYQSGNHALASGKTFRDGRGERVLQHHARLGEYVQRASGGEVRVAEPLGFVPELRLALFAWCASHPPTRQRPPSQEAAVGAVKVLARLHAAPPDGLPSFGPQNELAILHRWQSAIGELDDRVADSLDDLVRSLSTLPPPDGPATATIHRDFYGGQVLGSGGQWVLVDLDTVSRGDAATDVGNFLAHLWLDTLQSGDDAGQFASNARRALAEYRGTGGRLSRDSLRWYWASSLLRLGAVHAFRTQTAPYASALWQQAAQLMNGNGENAPSFARGIDLPEAVNTEHILSEVGD